MMKRTITLWLVGFFVCSEEVGSHKVRIQLDLCCPESREFESFIHTCPQNTEEQRGDCYEEFEQMMAGLESVGALFESGNIYSAACSVTTDDEIN